MDPRTERMIRTQIHLQRLPLYAAAAIFVSTVAGLALFGVLLYAARFLDRIFF